jgi:hypothetical protein
VLLENLGYFSPYRSSRNQGKWLERKFLSKDLLAKDSSREPSTYNVDYTIGGDASGVCEYNYVAKRDGIVQLIGVKEDLGVKVVRDWRKRAFFKMP